MFGTHSSTNERKNGHLHPGIRGNDRVEARVFTVRVNKHNIIDDTNDEYEHYDLLVRPILQEQKALPAMSSEWLVFLSKKRAMLL